MSLALPAEVFEEILGGEERMMAECMKAYSSWLTRTTGELARSAQVRSARVNSLMLILLIYQSNKS